MNARRFSSCLAPWFERFLELKQASGFSYSVGTVWLHIFDSYLAARLQDPAALDGAFLGDFVASLAHMAPRSRSSFVGVVWQALGYAIRRGAPCPSLPERPRYPQRDTRRPYIYTADEIDRMLCAALRLGPPASLRPHTIATALALLVTTGLRLGELRNLDLGDADLGAGFLLVRQGKFGKSRRLPLRPSSVQGLASYIERRRRASMPQAQDSPLLVTLEGARLSCAAIYAALHRLARAAGVSAPDGRTPRVHDLRHYPDRLIIPRRHGSTARLRGDLSKLGLADAA